MPVLSGLDLSGLPVFFTLTFLPFRSFASALSSRSLTKFPCVFFPAGARVQNQGW